MVLHSCRITLATFVAILSLGTSVERAGAATIVGAGTSVFDELVDTPNTGGRINVDNTTTIFLTAGSYIATLFSFDAGQPGDVTPFLAVETSPNVFTAIAVGATQNLLGTELDTTVPFGGAAVFTLATDSTIFAGISSSIQNPIFLDNGIGTTDHEAAGAFSFEVTSGGMVPPDGSFSHPDLGRTYAFSIAVDAIPEPSSIAVVLVGAVGLLGRRCRKGA